MQRKKKKMEINLSEGQQPLYEDNHPLNFDGIRPFMSSLFEPSRDVSDFNCPISLGIEPTMELELKSNTASLERLPICSGMDP
ncbi:hypothetical protein Scep_017407 [Stephania cephalantha]|uniref:Uncharacterized protein n=1 Tax=Stephania cephalantha TaxID=152367 RepID=A0AAP0IPI6_9MAGN